MICYQEGVSKGTPKPCTKEIWDSLIDSPAVKFICAQIAKLDPSAADYNEKKQALKKKLPIIIPHAAAFTGTRRVSAEAIPSGLAMLDVDHVAEPRQWWETLSENLSYPSGASATCLGNSTRAIGSRLQSQIDPQAAGDCFTPTLGEESKDFRQVLIENGIYFVAITASGQGLRVIGERKNGESIEAAQMRMAEALGITEYDAVTKDLARASYVVPRDYILWMDEEALLCPYPTTQGSPSPAAGEESKPFEQSEGRFEPLEPFAHEVIDPKGEPTYRDIPYADIVEELMVQTGNGGGAVQGERNTVYFALANYMRYICDFNAELLLQVLPDFGLSVQERKQAIVSAIGRPRKSQMPLILQGAIAMCEREQRAMNKFYPKRRR